MYKNLLLPTGQGSTINTVFCLLCEKEIPKNEERPAEFLLLMFYFMKNFSVGTFENIH